jgi:Na+-translocating ferredoxin:NAD+ oxidoreductase subunit B
MSDKEEALPYEKISTIIENGQSFLVNDCICKKEKGIMGRPCDRPVQVCLAVAPIPGVFDNDPEGRVISMNETYALLKKIEAIRLIHKDPEKRVPPPLTEEAWFDERGRKRSVDFSCYK